MLVKVLLAIAAIWLVLAVLGFILKLMSWAIVIGVVVLVVAAIMGFAKRSRDGS